jgi:hypothetical protein
MRSDYYVTITIRMFAFKVELSTHEPGDQQMPRLDILSLEQAQLDSSTGRRAQMLREYVAIIGQVPAGQAGKLAAGPGETLSAVRRRLGAAAKQSGRALIIKRTEEHLYFWVAPNSERRRPGRPPKNAS